MVKADYTRRFPIGATVETVVYSIGDRSETVTGKVTGHRYGHIVVSTETHGTLMVEPAKATRKGE